MKVSILVNEGSASASEVFTGAMRDHKKAKVYGSKTFFICVYFNNEPSLNSRVVCTIPLPKVFEP
jgi:hypothetical protein